MENNDSPMGFWKGLGVFFLLLLIAGFVYLPLRFLFPQPAFEATRTVASTLFATLLTIGLFKQGPVSAFAPFRFVPARLLLALVPLTFGWVAVELMLFYEFSITFPDLWKKLETLSKSYKQENPFLFALSVGLIVPFYEELVFRGFLLSRMRLKYSATKALLCNSALFALAHLNPLQAVPTFLLGMLNGFLRLRTASLIPAILVHALNNSISVAGSILDRDSPPDRRLPVYLVLVTLTGGALLFAAGVYLLRAALRQLPSPEPLPEALPDEDPTAPPYPPPSTGVLTLPTSLLL